MFKSSRIIITLICSSMLWVACGSDQNTINTDEHFIKSEKERVVSPVVSESELQTQVDGNIAFGFDLYQKVAQSKAGKNMMFSPHSISTAFAMLHAGARGNTETEVASTMHFELPQDKLHPVFNKLDQELKSRGKNIDPKEDDFFKLNIVNAMWGQKDYSFLPKYLDTLAENYGAGMHILDFILDAEGARQIINQWVEDQTNERIKDLLGPGSVDAATRLVLTNAVYFNATWSTKFEITNTKKEKFHIDDTQSIDVDMMNQEVDAPFAQLQDLQAVSIPYAGNDIEMLVIVPDAGKFNTVEANLNSQLIDSIDSNAKVKKVSLGLPRYEFKTDLSLIESLAEMGMNDVFSPNADLSGIDGTYTLMVTGVLHKSFIKVDEEGTEAAAATAIIVGESTSLPPESVSLKIDRPFIFLIRDKQTKAVLFVGRVINPTA